MAAAAQSWFAERAGDGWPKHRARVLELLARDAELREIVGLLGADALDDADRVALEVARIVREHVLGQSAFDPGDAFSSANKTAHMAALVVASLERAVAAVAAGTPADELDFAPVRRVFAELRHTGCDALEPVVDRARAVIDGLGREGAR